MIGGVITSTVLTLVVIPTFYEILDEWREKLLKKVGLGKTRAEAVGGRCHRSGSRGSDELGQELVPGIHVFGRASFSTEVFLKRAEPRPHCAGDGSAFASYRGVSARLIVSARRISARSRFCF